MKTLSYLPHQIAFNEKAERVDFSLIRLNDLHCLDLETMQWSLVMADTGNGQASICEQNFIWTLSFNL